MKLSDEININAILFNKYNILGKLCSTSQKLNNINKLINLSIKSILPDLEQFCQLSNIRNNIITIETSRSEFVTQLRFSSHELLYELRKSPDLAQIKSLKFKVNPELAFDNFTDNKKPSKEKKARKPNQTARTKLAEISENIKNLELKEAIIRLLSN